MLAKRLARQGLAVSGGVLAAVLSQDAASAHTPASLLVSTIEAASLCASGQAVRVGAISARIVALTEGVLKTKFMTRLKNAAMLLLAGGALLIGSVATYRGFAAGQTDTKKENASTQADGAENVGEVRRYEGHGGAVLRVAFSPDGRLAASSSMAGTVRLWTVATGKSLHVLEGHADRVDCVTFSPDGKRLLSAAWDGTVRLWDVETGKELRRFDSQGNPGLHVCNVVFFKEGKKFLWNAADHEKLQIWDVETGQMLQEFAEHPDHVCAVALSPDGKRVLEGNWDANLRLWDIETGKELRQFQGHTGRVYCVAVSPDGKLGLSASGAENVVILWELESGQEIRRFQGHTEPVDFVAFSPDGRRALSAGQDRMVRLWNVSTGKELRSFEGHTDRIQCVTFSPDGRYALSGGDDHTVRLWRLPK